jgi:hypothetical protein
MMAIGGGETRRAKPTSFSQRDYNRRRVRSLMQVLTIQDRFWGTHHAH